jgi:putative ABC transport system permease protein
VQVVYCGVDSTILQLKRAWRIDGRMVSPSPDPKAPVELLTGGQIAKENGWHVGQTVPLPGVDGKQGVIAGILTPTGGADDLFIYMPLGAAQRIFHRPSQLTHILVRLDQPENMDDVVANLRGCDAGLEMNVVPLAHLFKTVQALIESTRLLLYCVALIAVLAAGAGLSNTILMAVNERTREIGVLRALGASKGHIYRIVWAEAVLLCAAGACAGIAASIAGARGLEAWLRQSLPYAPTGSLMTPDAGLVVSCLIGSIILASALPAGRAARLSPALSLRAVGGDI